MLCMLRCLTLLYFYWRQPDAIIVLRCLVETIEKLLLQYLIVTHIFEVFVSTINDN